MCNCVSPDICTIFLCHTSMDYQQCSIGIPSQGRQFTPKKEKVSKVSVNHTGVGVGFASKASKTNLVLHPLTSQVFHFELVSSSLMILFAPSTLE